MTGALLWNHWFWITILTGTQCMCESLLIQPYDVPAPVMQRFATGDLAREAGQGETGDDGEPFIASDEARNVMVSKSVSVSRVSVEIGGVRVGKEIPATADDEGLIAANISDENENTKQSVKPKSFFQNLILQLKSIVAEKSDGTSQESEEAKVDSEFFSPDANLSGAEEYTLVYRDEDYVDDEELLTDDDLYHADDDLYNADEYLDYNYNYGYDTSDTYSDVIDINELVPGDYEDVNNESIDYNDYSKVEGNDRLTPASENKSVDNLVGEIPATDHVRPSPAKIRSNQARGRSLILPEPDLKHLSEAENDVKKTEQILVVKETEETLINNDERKVSEMDFVVDFSVSEPILDLNIKIGIFIGVALSVVTITAVVVLVTRRKARSAKLVIDEDHSTTDSQYAFSRPLKNNSNIIQEQFSNNVGKASFYPCDDLHSLDNDSFLTSLETISVKDKFTWD